MNRVIFIIDGFNLYHSTLDLERDTGVCTKWLNIDSLCRSYLQLIGKDAQLESIYYFTSLAEYRKSSGTVERHKCYIKCLEATGVKPDYARFKEKELTCPLCKSTFTKHEEKETDVGIASKLLELLHTNICDTVIIGTGDSDLAPAVETAKRLFTSHKVIFMFPYKRKLRQLAELAPGSFSIHAKSYTKHQFDNPFRLPNGEAINKPSTW